jgi:subtilisin family serine protease
LFLILLLALCSPWTVQGKSYYVHDLDGSLIHYTIAESLVVAKFNTSLPIHHAAELALALPSLRNDTLVIAKHRWFYQYNVEPGFSNDSALAELRSAGTVWYAMPVFIAQDTLRYYTYDDILIAFKPEVGQASIDSLFEVNDLTVISVPDSLSAGYHLSLAPDSPKDPFDLSNEAFEAGLCEFAQPNFVTRRFSHWAPNDEYFNYQWHLYHNEGMYGTPGVDIDMKVAWDYARGDTTLIVAIIDGAFDIDHEDLNHSKVFAARDVCGDSLAKNLPDNNPRLPTNGNENDSYYWHGTACLGIMSAMKNNYYGVAGMISDFRYMPIKDTDDHFDSDADRFEDSWRWAITHGAHAISASIGYYVWYPNVNYAIRDAYRAGIAIAVAAGNNRGAPYVSYPADLNEVLGVSATDPYDNKASYAQFGTGLDVMAPSNSITTIDVTGQLGYNPNLDRCFSDDYEYYCQFGGTSASTPQVAALAVLIRSRRPSLACDTCSAEAIYEVIRHSSEDQISPDDSVGYDYVYGWGRINAARALLAVVRGDADNNGIINISDATRITNYVFDGTPPPIPHVLTGDADGNGHVNISDAVRIVNYVFSGAPPPPISFKY